MATPTSFTPKQLWAPVQVPAADTLIYTAGTAAGARLQALVVVNTTTAVGFRGCCRWSPVRSVGGFWAGHRPGQRRRAAGPGRRRHVADPARLWGGDGLMRRAPFDGWVKRDGLEQFIPRNAGKAFTYNTGAAWNWSAWTTMTTGLSAPFIPHVLYLMERFVVITTGVKFAHVELEIGTGAAGSEATLFVFTD